MTNIEKEKGKYIAFLRGINVGGHHKVPMADLKNEMKKLGFENIVTLLNSGNIIFEAISNDIEALENTISKHLEKAFGFPIPTILRTSEVIFGLIHSNPFKYIVLTKEIRLYVSFLRNASKTDLELPWTSSDKSFQILSESNKTILSVLDLSINNTPKSMQALENSFGKDITTRNWNTIKRIHKKLEDS